MEEKRRPIRSFVRRQGRMTPGQQRAYDKLWLQYGLSEEQGVFNYADIFGREADTIVEIGFGMGEALLEFGKTNPDKNYIGIDVHKPGVGAVLMGCDKNELTNTRACSADAIEVLNQQISNNSLAGVHLFFPDPWHKKRHHKRRIVNPAFVELIQSKLKPNGYFHMATDWEHYAEQMIEVMNDAEGFINTAGHGHFSDRPASRPLTRFEKRGERLGHQVWDLIFVRRDDSTTKL